MFRFLRCPSNELHIASFKSFFELYILGVLDILHNLTVYLYIVINTNVYSIFVYSKFEYAFFEYFHMVGEKLKTARLLIGKSQVDAAQESGLSQRDISLLENDKKEFIPTEYIQYLNKSGIDVNSIYKVDDNVHLNAHLNAHLNDKKEHYYPVNKKETDTKYRGLTSRRGNIILVPVKARAGYLAGYGDQEYYEQLETFSIPGCTNGNYRMFEIEGESMFPTLSPGDYVVGRAETDCNSIRPGTIYIMVSRSEGIIIKRVLNVNKTFNKLTLSSDNISYQPIEVDCATIAEMWEFYMLLTTMPVEQDPAAKRLRILESEVSEIKQLLHKK